MTLTVTITTVVRTWAPATRVDALRGDHPTILRPIGRAATKGPAALMSGLSRNVSLIESNIGDGRLGHIKKLV